MKKTLNFEIERLDVIDSTNEYLKKKAIDGEKEGTVVIADHQLKGKGQNGRVFCSPKGDGIYMSIIFRPDKEIIPYITRLLAVAVAHSINEIDNRNAKIKWVNDIYIDGKKCAGILCESNIDMGYVVAGIGIDVTTPKDGFDDSIKDIAIACLDGIENAKELLLERVLFNIKNLYLNFDSKYIVSEYRNLSMLIGKSMYIFNSKSKVKVLDINDAGALIFEYEDGTQVNFMSGDMKLL